MQEFISNLLMAVITAAVPVITAYGISLIKKMGENAEANTGSVKEQGYIREITDAITGAVSATSQTYVDALKSAGKFTKEAQEAAAKKSLTACLASNSPAAQAFIESAYGDVAKYLSTKIEAEVRKQKISSGTPVTTVLESSVDTTAVAATTAAATAATIAIQQSKGTE